MAIRNYHQKLERMRWVRKIKLPDELCERILHYLFCCNICIPNTRGWCARWGLERYCRSKPGPPRTVYDGINTTSPLYGDNVKKSLDERLEMIDSIIRSKTPQAYHSE